MLSDKRNNGLRCDLKQMAACLIVCCAEHSSGVCSGDWDESCGISWQQPAALHWAHSQTSAVQRSNIYGESLFPFVSSYFSYVFFFVVVVVYLINVNLMAYPRLWQHSGIGGAAAGKKNRTWKNLKQILALERTLPWKLSDPNCKSSVFPGSHHL